MGLEKTIFSKKFSNAIKTFSLVATLLSSSCNLQKQEDTPKSYEYKTTITSVESKEIDSETGGLIEITNPESFIYGTKLKIPAGALQSDTTISVGEVNNPPALPAGLNYVGTSVDFGPDGINFNNSLTIQIPYSDESLNDAGLSDDSNLKLYSYSESSKNWEEINILTADTENNIITAGINHFSHYTITGFNCPIPEDLGNPQRGDLLYSLGAVWDEGNPNLKDNWMPGHVGIYVGERIYSGGLASEDVKKLGKYNVVEALPWGVQFTYYNPISDFSGLNAYAGAREPKDFTLTLSQRDDIVAYVEDQVGQPYAMGPMIRSIFGLAAGSVVKGPYSFNCVGLAEAAYEFAKVNNREGLVHRVHEIYLLTPAEQYKETKPARGSFKIPLVSYTTRQNIDSQIAVMNEDGSNIQEITSSSLTKNYPRFSPDRDKIIFEQHERNEGGVDISTLYTINLDGSGLTELVGSSQATDPAWSINDEIVYVTQWGAIELYITDINFSNKERLTATQISGFSPSFSPDGNEVVYAKYYLGDLAKTNVTSKNETLLITGNDLFRHMDPEFSPNGDKITFSSYTYEREYIDGGPSFRDSLVNADIYLYDNNSTNIQQLTFDNYLERSPHFSKDGSKILFSSNADGTYQIYSVNVDGSGKKKLTQGPKNHTFGEFNY
ncbi:MAG: hypothetical protein PHQ66_03595 [Candidatus Nanoarchaeia archaeon]|nr:hypothetical protein [Candidatus Nanoarchaeia archaeon]MDD5357554.1 hypothetical protein [Candidatus Nanoarchaeia archaeon]MDD5588473.1 hypothetical protein [Candidatus Nanoarchaeia archaeon]